MNASRCDITHYRARIRACQDYGKVFLQRLKAAREGPQRLSFRAQLSFEDCNFYTMLEGVHVGRGSLGFLRVKVRSGPWAVARGASDDEKD